MSSQFRSLLGLALLALLPFLAFTAVAQTAESSLIDILRSNRAPQEIDAACVQLKRVGTAAAVPALATLLTNEHLSHSARLALESIPGPEADAALLAALFQTTGFLRAGVVDSIGQRGDPNAVPFLADLLHASDGPTQIAAATALGRMDGSHVPGILNATLQRATGTLRLVVLDSLLRQANLALNRGDRLVAHAIFLELNQPGVSQSIRTAAYRGLIAASDPDESLALVTSSLQGDDGPAQVAALSMLHQLAHPHASQTLANLLPTLVPATQAAVIEAMAQRDDSTVTPAVLAQAHSEHLHVQIAAISAIGRLGDHTAIPTLLHATVSSHPPLQQAARESLLTLRRGPVTGSLLRQLESASGATRTEIIRALGGRADSSAIPTLIELAANPDSTIRTASLRAIALLATPEQLPQLTRLLLAEDDPTAREEAQRALTSIIRRAQERGDPVDPQPIVDGISDNTQTDEARIRLLQVSALLPDPEIRAAIRGATQDSRPTVRDAAFRTLCESRDPALLPDLLVLARDPVTAAYRSRAIRGFVRLATEPMPESDIATAVEQLAHILAICDRPEEHRVVLAGLATQPTPESLALAVDLLESEDVRAEAIQAVVQIASRIAANHPDHARPALRQALSVTTQPTQRQTIESQLAELDAAADYLTVWQVAGPYRQEGADYTALFDIAFPPENPNVTEAVAWMTLPDSSSPRHPGIVDLLKSLGGEQCVAYLRTAVYSPVQQPARLELGTDDGVKAWLNGSLVHAHNIARPLTIGSDQMAVMLQSGWNTLLLKITQNNLGWEFSARFVQPDGARLPEQKADPLHAM
jgi:HEAT repeat protein